MSSHVDDNTMRSKNTIVRTSLVVILLRFKTKDQRSASLCQISRCQEDVPRGDVAMRQLGTVGIAFLKIFSDLLNVRVFIKMPSSNSEL